MENKQIIEWSRKLIDANAKNNTIHRCVKKMIQGDATYGEWSPHNDEPRNFASEIHEELYDCINYCIMALLIEECQTLGQYNIVKFKEILKTFVKLIETLPDKSRLSYT